MLICFRTIHCILSRPRATLTSQKAGAVDLIFKNISVAFNKKPILNNVSGMAKSGTMLAVMGPSGKSPIQVSAVFNVYCVYL